MGSGTIRLIAYEFLFVFHCNYGYILIVSDILVQNANFSYSLPFNLHDHREPLDFLSKTLTLPKSLRYQCIIKRCNK